MHNKEYKPFFVTDANGKLFKAVPVKDEDIPVEEEEEKKILKQAGAKDEGEGLSPEELAIVRELIAERKAAKADEHADGDVHDEDKDEDIEVDETIEKDKVIDTSAKDSVKKGFNSVQKKKETVIKDSGYSLDVEKAWADRYK